MDEPYAHYLFPQGEGDESTVFDVRERYGPVTVPADHYFMMGDNRDNSQDSRYWGFLPAHYVKGRALMIYWSFDAPGGTAARRAGRRDFLACEHRDLDPLESAAAPDSLNADLIIENADLIYTCAGPAPRRGVNQRDATPVARASIASWQGRIVYVGAAEQCRAKVSVSPGATVIDGRDAIVVPGFVDPHTHLVFAGDRREELLQRLGGATYAAIAARGGGIVTTVAATRTATEHALEAGALPRLAAMLACGTTTAEVKSGYGLETASELRMLRAIRMLDGQQPIELVATFMGAHEIPVEYRHKRADYVALVIEEMLPAVRREQLAEWCDVFCEAGVFTPDETRSIFSAARRLGLKLRVHADELALSGGAIVAAEMGAQSADHLIFADGGARARWLPPTSSQRFCPRRRFISSWDGSRPPACSSNTTWRWHSRPTSTRAVASLPPCRL